MDGDASPNISTPRLLIFDLDNTLYCYDRCHQPALARVLDHLSNRFNTDLSQVRAAYDSARSETKARLGERASSHSRLLYLLKTFELLGFGARPSDALMLEQIYWRTYLARMELADGVRDLFNLIKAYKLPAALATDLTAAIQIRKLVALGLAETFDYIVTSEECAGEKASGSVYELLLEKAGIEPGPHLWMIGDSDSDMQARNHIGATTVFADLFDGAVPSELPTVTVKNLRQLENLIERVCGNA